MIDERKMTLDEINAMDKKAFVAAFGSVFEESPWAAQTAYNKIPFASLQEFKDNLCQVVDDASEEAKLNLLRAHPELGSKAKMADASVKEQRAAGISDSEDSVRSNLLKLNEAYRTKFDFPYIIAVKGLTPADILENMQTRLNSDRETEFKECLSQVMRIAGFRLDDLLEEEE